MGYDELDLGLGDAMLEGRLCEDEIHTDEYCMTKAASLPGTPDGSERASASVDFGWPVATSISHTVRRAVAVELCRRDGNVRELVCERPAVDCRQEVDPREGVGKRLVQSLAVVNSQVAESAS